jgi:hypothetical protein
MSVNKVNQIKELTQRDYTLFFFKLQVIAEVKTRKTYMQKSPKNREYKEEVQF